MSELMTKKKRVLRLRIKQVRGNLHALLRILEKNGWTVEFV